MEALNRSRFDVRERGGLLKAANTYDILDPDDGHPVLLCREPQLGRMIRWLRYTDLKRTTPFDLHVTTPDGRPVLRMTRGVPVVVSRVRVFDEDGALIGGFRQKPFSVAGAFDVLDAQDQPVCALRGSAVRREFQFLAPDGIRLARVTRRRAGFRRAWIRGADDYLLEIHDAVPPDSVLRRLIVASVLCVGLIQKVDIP